ncbi:hypothetical protein ACNVED_09925 [Legionella sp. D16C41]|uniref:hypothetical protein n=1 Tax=Legionella sp. D16C41 TaxID=3402688 RepID=UPI003AF794CC
MGKRKHVGIKPSTEQKKQKLYKNEETFAFGIPIEDIPENQRLVLDNYVFDISELAQLQDKDLFTNMHTQSEFSNEAKNKLLSCHLLKDRVQKLLNSKIQISEVVMNKVYNLGMTLLEKRDGKESIEALAEFQQFLDSLPPNERNTLLNFNIQMREYNNRAKTYILSKHTIGEIYSLVSRGELCVRAAGNWFIQAVRMTYPDMVNEALFKKFNRQVTPIVIQNFTIFANRQTQVPRTHVAFQEEGRMQRELNKMMEDNKKNQEALLSIVNTL